MQLPDTEGKRGFEGLASLAARHEAALQRIRTEASRKQHNHPHSQSPGPSAIGGVQSVRPDHTAATASSQVPSPAAHGTGPSQGGSPQAKATGSSGERGVWIVIAVILAMIALAVINKESPSTRSMASQPSTIPAPRQLAENRPPVVQTAYVVVDAANMRSEPTTSANRLATLEVLDEVHVVRRMGDWTHVRVPGSSIGSGYVATRLLHIGSRDAAVEVVCGPAVRPSNGEVLSRSGSGSHSITLLAGAKDTLIKLKRGGSTRAEMYVHAQQRATLPNIPDGMYTVYFASGQQYSTKCGMFLHDMVVTKDPEVVRLEETSDGAYIYSQQLQYELRSTSGGTFVPASADPRDFAG